MYFLSSRTFEQLALALKTEFALKFFKPGGAVAPPPRTPMLTALARRPTPLYPLLQDNVMQLSKFLVTNYQFSSVRIPIEYVVVLRGVRLAVL